MTRTIIALVASAALALAAPAYAEDDPDGTGTGTGAGEGTGNGSSGTDPEPPEEGPKVSLSDCARSAGFIGAALGGVAINSAGKSPPNVTGALGVGSILSSAVGFAKKNVSDAADEAARALEDCAPTEPQATDPTGSGGGGTGTGAMIGGPYTFAPIEYVPVFPGMETGDPAADAWLAASEDVSIAAFDLWAAHDAIVMATHCGTVTRPMVTDYTAALAQLANADRVSKALLAEFDADVMQPVFAASPEFATSVIAPPVTVAAIGAPLPSEPWIDAVALEADLDAMLAANPYDGLTAQAFWDAYLAKELNNDHAAFWGGLFAEMMATP